MSDYKAEIEKFETTKRFSGSAHTIKTKLEPLKSHIEVARNRWFWELLQNAHDYNDTVEIEVEFTNDGLEFRHNGKPFTYTQARNLIEPDSDKDNEEQPQVKKPVGQFGTGFLATHILSTLITVSGAIETEDKQNHFGFTYTLDRKTTDKDFLMQSIATSLKQLNADNPPPVNGETKTIFQYNFKQPYEDLNSFDIAQHGLAKLDLLLPYVLPFLSSVQNITVGFPDKPKFHYKGQFIESPNPSYKIFKTEKSINGTVESETLTAIFEDKTTSVLVEIKITDKGVFIIKPTEVLPKLFKFFPFVGTEAFNFPVIVQSNNFNPRTERDGIEISANDTDNRNSIISAVTAYKKLLDVGVSSEWRNLYLLCDIKNSDFSDTAVKTWYQSNVVDEIRKAFLQKKVVEVNSEKDFESINLSESLIPFFTDKPKETVSKIYDFGKDFKPKLFPKDEHYFIWCNQLDFTYFEKQKFDLVRLVKEVSATTNLTTLKQAFATDFNLKLWLNNLIQFVIEKDKQLLETYPIIPNQNEIFTAPSKLDYDISIPPKLKEILFALSEKNNWKDILLLEDYKEHIPLFGEIGEKNTKDICNKIDTELNAFSTNRKDTKFLAGVNSVLDWMKANQKEYDEKTLEGYFPWVFANKAQIYLETFSDPKIRDNIFVIAQSEKTESLAKLAQSNLSNSDIEMVSENIDEFKLFLVWLKDRVDDEAFADDVTGDEGEKYVYSLLTKKFGEENVDWASKNGEGRFDFQVFNLDKTTKFYVDAKTTSRGMANSNSVPFYMRQSQWNFLDQTESHDKYYIARVFRSGGELRAKWLKVNKGDLI